MFLKHKSEAAKLRRPKFRDKMIKTSDPEVLKMNTLISHAASAWRMQTSRRLRAEVMREIDQPNVLRIATILDTIMNYKDYVIIASAIADTIRIKDIRVGKEVQGIVFGDQTIPSRRTMQPVTRNNLS